MAFRAAAARGGQETATTRSAISARKANHFDKIEEMFKTYGDTGMCKRRYYVA